MRRFLYLTFFFVFYLFFSFVGATSFHPVSIEKMILAADAIVIGYVLKLEPILLEDDIIATEVRIKLEKYLGVDDDRIEEDELRVHYPGGTLLGRIQKVEGSPALYVGQKIVLMLKKDSYRYWIQGLASGVFKVLSLGNNVVLVNSVFPNSHNLSPINLEVFIKKVYQLKKTNLSEINEDKYSLKFKKQKNLNFYNFDGRSISSVKNSLYLNEDSNLSAIWWLLVLLSFSFWRRKKLE